jgi:hypothetical protein
VSQRIRLLPYGHSVLRRPWFKSGHFIMNCARDVYGDAVRERRIGFCISSDGNQNGRLLSGRFIRLLLFEACLAPSAVGAEHRKEVRG